MDEEQLVDWYDVVQQVANGRTDGHLCPACGEGRLDASLEIYRVTVRCSSCGQGFVGSLAHGRDDALYAEAIAMEKAAAARARGERVGDGPAPGQSATTGEPVVECDDNTEVDPPAPTEPPPETPNQTDPWTWKLTTEGSGDFDALASWMDVVESVHNGRSVGLNCPYCSEPLHDITVRRPYLRVRCTVCGEAFEGRLG